MGNQNRICKECGDVFDPEGSRRTTCSTECQYASRRKDPIQKTCPWCAEDYKTKDKRKKYCSKQCYNEYMRETGGHNKGRDFGEEWRRKISRSQKGREPWNKGLTGDEYKNHYENGFSGPRLEGEDHPQWNGGITRHSAGYISVRKNGEYVLEHRWVMEKHLDRKLEKNEVVHHKNGDKTDNRIENLEVMTRAEHLKHHRKIGDIDG